MIRDAVFVYGNPKIKFNKDALFLDPVANCHDLTVFENNLDDKYAVYKIEVSNYNGRKFLSSEWLWGLVVNDKNIV